MKLSISTTRRENLFGYLYLAFYQILLPDLIVIIAQLLGYTISLTVLNIIYLVVNFTVVVVIFRRFLWQSLQAAWIKRWRCLLYVAGGFLIYYFLLVLMSFIIAPWVSPNFSNVNDDTIIKLANEHTAMIGIGIVLLGPITEEMIFRGIVFQSLHRKSRKLAYCASVLLFATVHVWDYIGSADWKTLLICFIQYLPAGIVFARIYEASDTIVAPMLLHIILNLRSFSATR